MMSPLKAQPSSRAGILKATPQSEEEDPRETVCRMLADCKVLLVAKIGPMPAEKLQNAGIEAIDAHVGKPIETALTEVFAEKTLPQSDEPIDTSTFRLAHAMLRVADIERSIDFYTRLLGMKVLEQRDHKKNQFTQVYLGYGDGSQMTLELVFNWMQEEPYTKGDAFGHIAIQVTGINRLCNRLAAEGVPLPRAPRGQRHGNSIIAFIEDPDGHRIELFPGRAGELTMPSSSRKPLGAIRDRKTRQLSERSRVCAAPFHAAARTG